jgi:hypothetical protein
MLLFSDFYDFPLVFHNRNTDHYTHHCQLKKKTKQFSHFFQQPDGDLSKNQKTKISKKNVFVEKMAGK